MQKIKRALLSGSSAQCRLSAAWRPLLAPLVAPKQNAVWPPPISSSMCVCVICFRTESMKNHEKATLQEESSDKACLRIMRCLPSNGGQRLCSRLVLPYTEHENGEHMRTLCREMLALSILKAGQRPTLFKPSIWSDFQTFSPWAIRSSPPGLLLLGDASKACEFGIPWVAAKSSGFCCFWLARTIASVDEKMSDSRFNSPSLRSKHAHAQNQVNGKNMSTNFNKFAKKLAQNRPVAPWQKDE